MSENKQQFVARIRILSVLIVLVAFTLLLRHLLLVLSISYEIKGFWPQTFAALLFVLSINTLFFFFHYLAKLGPEMVITFHSMKSEWKLKSPLERIIIFSGMVSLPVSLITIAMWLSQLTANFFHLSI